MILAQTIAAQREDFIESMRVFVFFAAVIFAVLYMIGRAR